MWRVLVVVLVGGLHTIYARLCNINGARYKPGRHIHLCKECICRPGGTWRCKDPLCNRVKCDAGQTIQYSREIVRRGCYCRRQTCVGNEKSLGSTVTPPVGCVINNAFYKPGPLVESCRSCQCNVNGAWRCQQRCNFPTHMVCNENETLKRSRVETYKSCFCDKVECVAKPKIKKCLVRGVQYPSGPFVSQCQECYCDSEGRWKCEKRCHEFPPDVVCRHHEETKRSKVEALPRCYCDKVTCVPKPQTPAPPRFSGCKVGDDRYNVGDFINDCRKCTCLSDGTHTCQPKCPPLKGTLSCKEGFELETKDFEVMKGCMCKELKCVSIPIVYKCEVGGKRYQSGMFMYNCRRCNCQGDGTHACEADRCPQKPVRPCPAGETRVRTRVKTAKGCECTQYTCKRTSLGCKVAGKWLDVGPFARGCQECMCRSDKTWSCDSSVCDALPQDTCPLGFVTRTTTFRYRPGCYCKRNVCIDPAPHLGCLLNGRRHELGFFLDSCRKCECQPDGRTHCEPLCRDEPAKTACRSGQVAVAENLEVLPGCYCNQYVCKAAPPTIPSPTTTTPTTATQTPPPAALKVCTIDGQEYKAGEFLHNCEKCECRTDGTHKCQPLCRHRMSSQVECDQGYIKKVDKSEVVPGCFCEATMCVKQPVVCTMDNMKYPIGSFIHKCESCECLSNGKATCKSLCKNQDLKLTCKPGWNKEVERQEVEKGCFCESRKCVDPTPHLVCTIDDSRFAVGHFQHGCQRCVCRDDGKTQCQPLCEPQEDVVCRKGHELKAEQVEVAKECACERKRCRPIPSQGCVKDGTKYETGTFMHKCRQCVCGEDGIYTCEPSCEERKRNVTCGKHEVKAKHRVEITKGCFCETHYCTKPRKVCNVLGRRYPPGNFTDSCRLCVCNPNGSWRCQARCPYSAPVYCPYRHRVIREEYELVPGCKCDRLKCVNPEKVAECNVRGYRYAIGKFTHQCQQCVCRTDTSWTCQPKCPYVPVRCSYPEKIRMVREETTRGCYCDQYKCVDPNPHLVCNVYGTRHAVGSFVNSCRKCTCNADGSWVCPDQCNPAKFPQRVSCPAGNRLKRIDVEVLKGCYCTKFECEDPTPHLVCSVDGKKYAAGNFINKCRQCTCRHDGSWKCLDQCDRTKFPSRVTCAYGEQLKRTQVAVLPGCYCEKFACIDPTPHLVCNVQGKRHAAGSFVNKCRKCTCNANGSWRCADQCDSGKFPSRINCPYGHQLKRTNVEVLSGCYCEKLSCVDPTPNLVCNVQGKRYAVGSFVNKCRKCTCNANGSWRCADQCDSRKFPSRISCPYGHQLKQTNEEVLPGCYCRKLSCVDPRPDTVCVVADRHGGRNEYTVGSFINKCRKCTCNADGSWVCPDQCDRNIFPRRVQCKINEELRRTKVESLKGCYCEKLECVVTHPGKVCKVDGKLYAAGSFVSRCRKCTCRPTGGWTCLDQCDSSVFPSSVKCAHGFTVKRTKVKVLEGCYCEKLECTDPTPRLVCNVYGERYAVGSFINKCRKCICKADGSYVCQDQCDAKHFPDRITCASDEDLKRTRVQVLDGCYCEKLSCYRSTSKVCNIEGEEYGVGTFVSADCRRCTCRNDGSWSCNSLCKQQQITCHAPSVLVRKKVTVEKGCTCEKLSCSTPSNTGCMVDGKRYALGNFIHRCRRCVCEANGKHRCSLKCPPQKTVCQSSQHKKVTKYEVTPGCYCDRVTCNDAKDPVCHVKGVDYAAGEFVSECKKCVCNTDGAWSCQTQCRAISITCRADQEIVDTPVQVLPGCFCKKSVCQDKPQPNQVCEIEGKQYAVGEFIHKCQKCTCFKAGTYRCEYTCGYNEPKCVPGMYGAKYEVEVSKGCYCTKIKCFQTEQQANRVNKVMEKREKKAEPRCTFEKLSYTYNEEFFDSACEKRCTCNAQGAKCKALCEPAVSHCPGGMELFEWKTHVRGSSCTCRKAMCLAKYKH